MTNPSLENTSYMLSERNEHARRNIERILKSKWVSNYAADILKTMMESELQRRPIYYTSTQIDQRPMLIQLCQRIARSFQLGRCAHHLAINYLDRFLDFYTIRSDKLQLIALTCMHIAAQIEHTDANVPRYSEMDRLIQSGYTALEFKTVERKLLTFFDFKLIHPTVASFVEMFAYHLITIEDYFGYCLAIDGCSTTAAAEMKNYPRYNSFEQMLTQLVQLLLRMSDYTLTINRFSNEPPSMLAASCIAATRQVSGVPKRWTPFLTDLTSYSEHMVEPYVDVIRLHHYLNEQSKAKGEQQQQHPMEISWSSPDSGFGENLSVPQMEVVSVEVETFNVITVKLQAPRKPSSSVLKRDRDNDYGEEQQPKRLKVDQEQQKT
ncbi:cyclin-J [Drosophila grimshawi]|uniref:GH16117 n=1 Tax=Drosophila grimshawi TaxID=7222 RepID=B4J3I0_DROGR|nr:cyclin-J [Drosophila grimshawi]EDV96182.1 GH16117 [Drosophila grimshawi]